MYYFVFYFELPYNFVQILYSYTPHFW